MRRPSRQLSQFITTPSLSVGPVAELYIDTDSSKPLISLDHFQPVQLSTESGSDVLTLRQFLDNNDNDDSSLVSQTVRTAILPGNAFDSLKYFLSTLH